MNEKLNIREFHLTDEPANTFVRTVGGPDTDTILINIHGGPALSHSYMLGLDQLASSELMVVNYDQRGTGRSIPVALESQEKAQELDDFSLTAYAHDLEAVRRAVAGDKKVHILAHSWGGLVAMQYAILYPEQIRSLLLVTCVPPTSTGLNAGFERISKNIQALQQKGMIPAELSTNVAERLQQILPVYLADPTTLPSLVFESTPGVGDLTWLAVEDFDLTEQVAKLDIPLQILFGEADPFGVEWAYETKAAFKNAKIDFVLAPDYGHFGWLESPEFFFRSAHNFLDQH
jgi:pimeloyl-ACP methyl ester carboxylesterase